MTTLAALRPWVPLPLLLLLLLLFVGAPLWIYYRSEKTQSPRLMGALVSLRVLAVLIAFLILVRPTRVFDERIEEKSHLAILIDNSRSMGQRDVPGGGTRADAVRRFWKRNHKLLAELKRNFELSVLSFDTELAPKEGARFRADGESTGIGPALRTFWRERRRGRLVGLVLFSDGNHNSGLEPVDAAVEYAAGKVPIYPVLVGTERPTERMRDLALADLVAPATVDLGNSFEVTVELEALAAIGETVTLICKFAGKEVSRRQVTIDRDRVSRRLRFEVPTELKGTHTLALKVVPIDGERTAENNTVTSEVRVHSRKVQVLLLEGVLRWETKFLRRALQGDPGVNLVTLFVVDPANRARLGRRRFLAQFDVILIGDVAAKQLPEAFGRALPELVARRTGDKERGRGLMLLGGWRAFSGGDWAASPVSRILPVQLADQPSRFEGEVLARPTSKGHRHFALRFSDDREVNRRIWARIPPLLDSENVARVKANGQVLLWDGQRPVLVVAPYGLGRVATLTTASTWRWVMNEKRTSAKYHRLFWRQLVLWLAKRDIGQRGKMWLTLSPARNQFTEGEKLRLKLHVVDPRWRPDPQAKVQLTVTAEGGAPERRTPTWDPMEKAFCLPLRAGRPGTYTVNGTASRDGKPLGSDQLRFAVRERVDVELANPLARADVLLRVSSRTRGRMVHLAGAAGLLRSLLDRKKTIVYTFQRSEDRWNHGFWLVLFALLLGAEWWLRKSSGFV